MGGWDAMLFCTKDYLFFLLAVFALYWATPRERVRVWLLLIASFTFYAVWSRELACIVAASSAVDFFLGQQMGAAASPRARKYLLWASLGMNLGLLVYFKYANFFIESFQQLLMQMGVTVSLPLLEVILPIGISFYTFEAINYSVDVYRRKIAPEQNLADFMLFILFFPHLVAGPIVRARDFLPQIKKPKRWSWLRLHHGIWLLSLGLFKKLAIADRMAVIVDPVFASPGDYSTEAIWMAAVAFAFQVYCDFSGYSDMAIGSAHLFGYRLTLNFNLPFVSRNVSEFWQRWHISLSTWLRDYLFIPLGGSRGSFWFTSRNLLITMSLGGLWHGANWNYVAWGVLQGILLVLHRGFSLWVEDKRVLRGLLETWVGTLFRILFTFCLFCWSLVVFRPASLGDSGVMFERMLSASEGLPIALEVHAFWLTVLLMVISHAIAMLPGWSRWASKLPTPLLGLSYATLLLLGTILAPGSTKAFIYFQF
jgi:alginate O-acetyltransferase complex protein AlgI